MKILERILHVPDDYEAPPVHPSEHKEYFYQRVIDGAKHMFQAQGTQLYVHGFDNLPLDRGALIVSNHTGWFDFIFMASGPYLWGRRLIRIMTKKEVFSVPFIGSVMRKMGHIPVDRAHGHQSVEDAITWASNGGLVGIFPEGTISRSFELSDFKTGAARIAQSADVPMIPCVIWGSQRIWTKDLPRHIGRAKLPVIIRYGEPVPTDGDPAEVTARLKQAMQELLDADRAEYDELFGPFEDGLRWRPASMGGSAPTLEEAKEIYRREREERAKRKEEKAQRKRR